MDKKEAIEFLKTKLNEIPHLKTLDWDNQEYKLWRDGISDILEAVFGTSSTEYKRFLGTAPRQRRYGYEQEDYPKELERRETAILSIIQKYGIPGIETEPTPIGKSEEVSGDGERGKVMKFVQLPLKYRMKIYYEELIDYKKLEGNRLALTTEEHKRHKFLREKLLREAQIFKDKIIELTNYHSIKIEGKTYDIWVEAFDDNFFSKSKWPSLDYCIDATNIAIGKLESIELKELGDKDSTDPHSVAYYLFDKFQFHPKVIEASRSCFVAGNYREAILNAFIGLIDHIKELTGLDLDGDDLMNKVFSLTYDKERRKITKYPIIRINDLKNSNGRNEQQGFMFLCKGAAGAIRNPKAHKLVTQSNPFHTLEYLAFASLLRRRIDESKLVKSDKEEHPH